MAANDLRNLVVIDLTQVVSGALATLYLAEFGADVVKVEPPGGEPYRSSGLPIETEAGGTNLNFLRFSRGKRSITLDLKSAGGKELLTRLLEKGDVLVENFRPGVMERLGFGPAAVAAINPRLIFASVSGFGHNNTVGEPLDDIPTFAITAEAAAGITHLAGTRDGPPVWMGFAMADILAGILAFSAILLAVRRREATGLGSRVDVSMFDGALLMNDLALLRYSVLGEVTERGDYALQAPWGPYPTTDGHVVIAVLSHSQWANLCGVIGRPELATDERLATGNGRAHLHEEVVGPAVTAWTSAVTKADAVRVLHVIGVPSAPVNDASDVINGHQIRDRDMLIKVHDDVVGEFEAVGNPIKLRPLVPATAGDESVDVPHVPRLGEHAEQVLKDLLEMDAEEIRRLQAQGVV